METFAMKLKRILQNKDTVTFLGIVLLIIVLYITYSVRVKSQIKTVTIPYASTDIMAGSKITQEMIAFREVPAGMIGKGVLTAEGDILDRYASGSSVIPGGSLFYEQAVVSEEQATISEELSYPEGFTKYSRFLNSRMIPSFSTMRLKRLIAFSKFSDSSTLIVAIINFTSFCRNTENNVKILYF